MIHLKTGIEACPCVGYPVELITNPDKSKDLILDGINYKNVGGSYTSSMAYSYTISKLINRKR